MSGRKLGRLLGTMMALVAFAAAAFGIISGEFGEGDLRTTEVEWGAPASQADASLPSGAPLAHVW